MQTETVQISAEATPNPNTLKFNVNRQLLRNGSMDFKTLESAKNAPLANELFGVPNVVSVLAGPTFVTVTKAREASWATLAEPCIQAVRRVLSSNPHPLGEVTVETDESSNDDPITAKIKQILDNEIRPAVAMDGGDIVFRDYRDGIVTLRLQGACSSCPSSIMTLKMGVENRLKSLIPEIQEVVQE